MNYNRANQPLNISDCAIQLSPPRVPPPASKRQRKKSAQTVHSDENAKNALIEKLFNDPLKKQMVMKLLESNKQLINQYKVKEQNTSSPVNKAKIIRSFESPTSLMRRRLLEKQKRQDSADADESAVMIENKLKQIAVTPSRKVPRKILLKGVHVYVEVFGDNNANQSGAVKDLLQQLGATVETELSSACTHHGRYETFRKAKFLKLPLVSILWLDAMDRTGYRVPAEMFPALGDHKEAMKINDAICKKFNGRRSLSASAIVQSELHSYNNLDDDHLLKMAEKEDESDTAEIIPGSQPQSRSVVFNMTTSGKEIQNADDDSNDDAASEASSTEPLISGHHSRKTRAELEASYKLSETLLNSPFIVKTRKTRRNTSGIQSESMTNSDDKENSPVANKRRTQGSCKTNLFKEITKRKEKDDNVTERPEERPVLTESPVANSPAPQHTPSRRKTLLHPELLGIVNDTNNCSLPMEITQLKNATLNAMNASTGNCDSQGFTRQGRRKTSHTMVDMDFSDNVSTTDNDIGQEVFESPQKKSSNINTTTTKNETVCQEQTVKKTIIDRTSLASTNTSKSDDLISYRRITRRMSSFLGKSTTPEVQPKTPLSRVNNSNNTKGGSMEAGSSSFKLSLRISGPSEKTDANVEPLGDAELKLQPTNDKTSNSSKDVLLPKGSGSGMESTNRISAASTRTSASDDLMSYKTNRRITYRMSTYTQINNENIVESANKLATPKSPDKLDIDTEQKKSRDPNNKTNISLKMTNVTSSSGVPSLRLSSQDLEAAPSKGLEQVEQVENIKVSPVSEISHKLLHTSLSTKTKVASAPPALMCAPMLSSTTETASTSYSIVDDSTEPSRGSGNQSSRSRSGRPSLISNLGTTRTTTSNKNVSKGSSQKRKLYNPDDELDDSRNGGDAEEEERRAHTQEVQAKVNMDAARQVLQKRLDSLNIPNPRDPRIHNPDSTEGESVDNEDEDSDFEFTPPSSRPTQRSQTPYTQTQSNKKKVIVCTRFHAEDISKFKDIIGELGEFAIEDRVSNKTTHLVALEASRTLNFLRAMSRGIWILRADWLFDSQEAGKWLDEDSYELTEFSRLVQELRLQRESFGKRFCHDVFVDCGAIFISPHCHPSCSDLIELVILCKGEVTKDLADAKIIIGKINEGEESDGRQIRTESQVHVTETWILDCITFGRIKRFNNYVIQ